MSDVQIQPRDIAHQPLQPTSPGDRSDEVNPVAPAMPDVPRSDVGTILLHWFTALSMIVSLFTGIRISAEGQFNSWAQALAPVLPQGEMWTWHIGAGLFLFFSTIAYLVYLRTAVLGDRNGKSRLRTITPPTTKRLRLRAINVALHWFAYGAIVAMTLTGILLYLGYGGANVPVHRILAWSMLFYIFVHSLAHFLYGGISQLLRLFRPLLGPQAVTRFAWPATLSLTIGGAAALALYAVDFNTHPGVTVAKVANPPTLDGILDDEVWSATKATTVNTHQGENLAGNGVSQVSIRAVRTEDKIHFAFQWQDPTRSLMRSPTIKKSDGWYVMSTGGATADVNDYYEDKFAVLLSHGAGLGGGRSTFLGSDPLPNYPKSPHGRGLHYTDDGRIMDLWQWKASRGGMIGHVDDMHFGPPKMPNAKEAAGKARYSAGYSADPGKKIYEYNYIIDETKGYAGPVQLKRLPIDLALMRQQLGAIPETADGANTQGSQWWMTREGSIPYDSGLDRHIPVGTIIPSTLNIHTYAGDRADLSGGAKWADGKWTLEISRALNTGSAFDIAFQPGTQINMWVSVFDHNQTRHTRHQRPVTLHIK